MTFVKHARYLSDDLSNEAAGAVEVLSRIDKNLQGPGLSGFVLEGISPYAGGDETTMAALRRAALQGIPTARVGRGNHGGITVSNANDLFVEGNNLTATKARLLLMACLMRYGSLPLPLDSEQPTATELDAIRETLSSYQAVFDSH